MPFKSKKQMRWMYANDPEMAKKWSKHTKNIESLPEKKEAMKSYIVDPELVKAGRYKKVKPIEGSTRGMTDEQMKELKKKATSLSPKLEAKIESHSDVGGLRLSRTDKPMNPKLQDDKVIVFDEYPATEAPGAFIDFPSTPGSTTSITDKKRKSSRVVELKPDRNVLIYKGKELILKANAPGASFPPLKRTTGSVTDLTQKTNRNNKLSRKAGKTNTTQSISSESSTIGDTVKSWRPNSIKGGIGDRLQPKDVDEKELEQGVYVEQEHVGNDEEKTPEQKAAIAQDIALDHLAEDKKYYTHLADMERRNQQKGRDETASNSMLKEGMGKSIVLISKGKVVGTIKPAILGMFAEKGRIAQLPSGKTVSHVKDALSHDTIVNVTDKEGKEDVKVKDSSGKTVKFKKSFIGHAAGTAATNEHGEVDANTPGGKWHQQMIEALAELKKKKLEEAASQTQSVSSDPSKEK